MKFVVLLSFLALSGCTMKGLNSTLFLKEDSARLYNNKGDDCLESGYQVISMDGEVYRLTTYYSNCDVKKDRNLKEFEVKQWLPEKKKINR